MIISDFCYPVIGSPLLNPTDFSSEDYSSSKEFLDDIKMEFKDRASQTISIGLWRPIESKSIPLLYRDLISFWCKNSQLKIQLRFYIASAEVLDHLYRSMPWPARPRKIIESKNKKQIIVTIGDIVPGLLLDEKVEAIVNASNENLVLGGGVSNSIKESAQPTLQKELSSLAQNKISIGEAVITGSHGIPGVQFIVHVPTSVGTEDAIFKGTLAVLKLAEKSGVRKIDFPALGTGTGGLSFQKCSELMFKAIDEFMATNPTYAEVIQIKLWTKSDFDKFV